MAAKTKGQKTSALEQAIEFIAAAQCDIGPAFKTHCKMTQGTVTANDSVLTTGHLINEQIDAVPNTFMLLKALKRCQEVMRILVTKNERIEIRSGRFKATVPCLQLHELPSFAPDPAVAHIDNRFVEAAQRVLPVTTENAERLIQCSILLKSGSVVATDGIVAIEAWHGIDMPPDLMVPRRFIDALVKIKSKFAKEIVSFGFSETTLTIYYADNSWIKTQLFSDKYPDVGAVLNKEIKPLPIPESFFTAYEELKDFPPDGRLRLRKGRLQSEIAENLGASYEVPGLAMTESIRCKDLKLIKDFAAYMDAHSSDKAIYFSGKDVRGAISKIKEEVPEAEALTATDRDDEIPF